MSHAKFFWWISNAVERRYIYLAWAMFFVFGLMLFGFLLGLAEHSNWALGGYAVTAGVTVIAFRGLSSELGQLARNEALRLQPGFSASLWRGVLLCHFLLTGAGVILSLSLKSWLPVVTVAYAAAVAACLILPVSTFMRPAAGDRLMLRQLGADYMTWAAILALILPAPALYALPATLVFVVMSGLALFLLLVLPYRLARMPGTLPDVSGHSVWRKPSLAVFGFALTLVTLHFLPTWNSDRSSSLLFLGIPWVGLTALGREASTLRGLLGRMWLSGLDRRRLCLHGIGRLSLAMAKEVSIYMGILLTGYAFGMTTGEQFVSAVFMVLTFGLMNGINGLEEILHGRPPFKNIRNILVIILPFIFAAAFCMDGSINSQFGVLAIVGLIAGVIWCVRDHLRRFETAELW